MEEFNTNRDGVGHTCVKPGEHNKLDEVVERIQQKTGLKASSEGEYSAGTITKPGSVNQGSEPGQSTYGAVESEQVFINIWCAGMGLQNHFESKKEDDQSHGGSRTATWENCDQP